MPSEPLDRRLPGYTERQSKLRFRDWRFRVCDILNAVRAIARYTEGMTFEEFAADARTNVGALSALDLHNRGVSGRLISVTLVGSAGSKTVSGSVFIAAFNANRPSGDPSARSTLLDLAPIP